MSAGVLVDGISKRFERYGSRVEALCDVHLAVAPGEFVCLTGPSGCGKTTLLNLIAGLEYPDAGDVFVGGRRVCGPSPERTVVFQDGALFPWLSCRGNVEYGLQMKGLSAKERAHQAKVALARVGLASLGDRYPHEVSGGQRQRVAIARALVLEPDVLLCDEPFASLDAVTRRRLAADVVSLWQATRMTVIWVEHNLYLPPVLADRVIVFGPGKILDEVRVNLPRPRAPRDPAVLQIGDWLSAWVETLTDVGEGIPGSLPAPPAGAEIHPSVH